MAGDGGARDIDAAANQFRFRCTRATSSLGRAVRACSQRGTARAPRNEHPPPGSSHDRSSWP
eukprot:3579521-Pyramimonas_sp.AAC.1